VLHSDNGSAVKGTTMRAAMDSLGVVASYSRPRVSNDNAYAEALFRTAKYCPLWPERPFDTLETRATGCIGFVRWYNEEHRHSGLKYVAEPAAQWRSDAPCWRDERWCSSRSPCPASAALVAGHPVESGCRGLPEPRTGEPQTTECRKQHSGGRDNYLDTRR
jgi:hypothetical protein